MYVFTEPLKSVTINGPACLLLGANCITLGAGLPQFLLVHVLPFDPAIFGAATL